MSGIGNTIETDLVGELAEIWQRDLTRPTPLATGRVRAATATREGSILIWLELVTADGAALVNDYVGRPDIHRIGDVVCFELYSPKDWGTYSTFLRLIKT